MQIECENPEAVVRRAFFLAYQAAGGTSGFGFMQARDNATEADVWNNVRTAGDYPGRLAAENAAKPGKAYGDYVFGRMLKLSLQWSDKTVTVPDYTPQRDYESWCRVYPTFATLIGAAIDSLAAVPA